MAPPNLNDSASEDVLELQCNIQNLDIGNYNNYEQDDVSNNKIKDISSSEKAYTTLYNIYMYQ